VSDRPVLDLLLFVLVGCSALLLADLYRDRERWKKRLLKMGLFETNEQPSRSAALRLLLASFAALFTEIMMIRWIGTEVRIFAYFQNLTLIACFLGFGLGCYWAQRRISMLLSAASMAFLVALIEAPGKLMKSSLKGLSATLAFRSDADLWVSPLSAGFPGKETQVLLALAAVLILIALLLPLVVVMLPFGQIVGRYFNAARNPVRAYSLNLLGSVAGIWAFAGLAFVSAPPELWFGVAFVVILLFMPFTSRRWVLGAALLAVSLGLLHFGRNQGGRVFWSPYQKLEVQDEGDENYNVLVNNTGYMYITNLSADYMARHPGLAASVHDFGPYDSPLCFAQKSEKVLIVGAGGGNDAAAALRHGAKEIDAVEIDPVVLWLGKTLHAEHPYASPRVHLILNDARAFLRGAAPRTYDVIVFGLLDSHTQFSDFSNMRPDNYVTRRRVFAPPARCIQTMIPYGYLPSRQLGRDPD